jgi:hypothetical protein
MRTFETIMRVMSIVVIFTLGVLLLCEVDNAKALPEYSTLFFWLYATLGTAFLLMGLYGTYREVTCVLRNKGLLK